MGHLSAAFISFFQYVVYFLIYVNLLLNVDYWVFLYLMFISLLIILFYY